MPPALELSDDKVNDCGGLSHTRDRLRLTYAPAGGGTVNLAVKWNYLVRDARTVKHPFGNVERPTDHMSYHGLRAAFAAGSCFSRPRSRLGRRRSRLGYRLRRRPKRLRGRLKQLPAANAALRPW